MKVNLPSKRPHLQAVVDHASVIIWSVDAHGLITMSEGKGLQAIGLASGQLVGQSVFEIYEDNPKAIAHVHRALNGETFFAEIEIVGRIYETHYSPLMGSAGIISGAVGISTDITKRWEAEQQQVYLLKLSDALRSLSDPQQIKAKAMQVMAEHLKVSRCYYAEILEDDEHCIIDNSFHAEQGSLDGTYRLDDFGKAKVAALRTGEVIIAKDVANDTSVTQAEREMNLLLNIQAYINVPLVKNNRLICLLGINQSLPRNWTTLDIIVVKETAERTWAAVERARAEIRIQQSEKQFRDIIEAIPQLVWVCNAAGEAIFFNERWYRFTNSQPEETLGHKWMALLHPADVAETEMKWNEAQKNAAPFMAEFRLKNSDGHYRWMLSHGIPILNRSGRIDRWFGTCTDIDERKHFAQRLEEKVEERTIELKESNRLLQRSNDELKEFAYVSSHDLQEPLRKIQTFSTLALDEIHDTELVKTYLKKIDSSAARMSALIKDVLQFSESSGALNFEPVDLKEILEEVKIDFELLIHQKQANVKIDFLPIIKGSRLQMKQLFTNLMSNALKFSNGEALITLNYRLIEGEEILELTDTGPKKKYHYLSFSDNGIGFEQDHAEQIFKLFTRLHNRSVYTGTGIGLALCKKIVENHDGIINATSRKGFGSTFHIYLPATL